MAKHATTRERKRLNRAAAEEFVTGLRAEGFSVVRLDAMAAHWRIYAFDAAFDMWGATHRFRTLNGAVRGIGLAELRPYLTLRPQGEAA